MADQQPAGDRAISIELLAPEKINVVVPDTGEAPVLQVHLLCGQASPGLFMFSKQVTLGAEQAISLGEFLAKEGRKAKLGLAANVSLPADVRG